VAEVAPVRSIRMGNVTSDMGAGDVPRGESVPSCDPGLADDGRLDHGSGPLFACELEPRIAIHTFENGVDDIVAFGNELTCAMQVGTGGCGFEQQLCAAIGSPSSCIPSSAT